MKKKYVIKFVCSNDDFSEPDATLIDYIGLENGKIEPDYVFKKSMNYSHDEVKRILHECIKKIRKEDKHFVISAYVYEKCRDMDKLVFVYTHLDNKQKMLLPMFYTYDIEHFNDLLDRSNIYENDYEERYLLKSIDQCNKKMDKYKNNSIVSLSVTVATLLSVILVQMHAANEFKTTHSTRTLSFMIDALLETLSIMGFATSATFSTGNILSFFDNKREKEEKERELKLIKK